MADLKPNWQTLCDPQHIINNECFKVEPAVGVEKFYTLRQLYLNNKKKLKWKNKLINI